MQDNRNIPEELSQVKEQVEHARKTGVIGENGKMSAISGLAAIAAIAGAGVPLGAITGGQGNTWVNREDVKKVPQFKAGTASSRGKKAKQQAGGIKGRPIRKPAAIVFPVTLHATSRDDGGGKKVSCKTPDEMMNGIIAFFALSIKEGEGVRLKITDATGLLVSQSETTSFVSGHRNSTSDMIMSAAGQARGGDG